MKPALAIGLMLAATLLYWPGQRADFTYDDIDFVVQNASIRSPASAAGALLAPFPPEQRERGLFRPLTNLSYAFDHALFGLDARAFQRSNALLYGVVVAGALALYALTLPGWGIAFAAASVFAFHPVHSEAVASISGRSELLALAFSLCALLLFEAARRAPSARGRRLALSAAGVYALACLSKETAVVLPAVFAARLVLEEWPRRRHAAQRLPRAAALLLPSLFVLIAVLVVRVAVLGAFTPGFRVLANETLPTRLWTAGAVYAEYLRLLAWPSVLQLDFYYQAAVGIHRSASTAAVVGLAAAAGALVWAAGAAWKHVVAPRSATAATDAHGDDSALRGVALFHAALAAAFFFPVAHVIGFGALMAERFLFAPSLGLAALVCLLVGAILRRGLGNTLARSAVAAIALTLFAVTGALRSVERAAEWRDGVALWASAARLLPGDARVHSNLGKQFLERGQLADAETSLQRALALEPSNAAALLNLAVVRERQGRDGEALESYRRLLDAHPRDFVAWNNRGAIEARRGQLTKALESFERALAINPNEASTLANRERMQQALAAARRFVRENRHAAEERREPPLAREVAAACRALEDEACAIHFERLARSAEAE